VAALEVSERYADGLAELEELNAAAGAAMAAYEAARTGAAMSPEFHRNAVLRATMAVVWAAKTTNGNGVAAAPFAQKTVVWVAREGIRAGLWAAREAVAESGQGPVPLARAEERKHQEMLLRDIFGNPFRRLQIEPSWLQANGGAVSQIAQAIYNQRDFDSLPILADVLEEGGCTNTDLQAHCRMPGDHVRGCWLIDALLGNC
jgi:hypothetical protein